MREEGGQQEVVRKRREEQWGEGKKGKKHNYICHNDILHVVCGYANQQVQTKVWSSPRETPGLFCSRTMDWPRTTYIATDVQMVWFINILLIYFMYVCLHVCPCSTCMQCLQRPKEIIGSGETEVTESCEPQGLCEC